MHKKTNLFAYVDLDELRNQDDITVTLQATPDECVRLAERLKIPSVASLQARVVIKQGLRRDLFDIAGNVEAKVTQECSVTLTPLQEAVNESFEEMLTTSPNTLSNADDVEDDRPVELIENNRIDLGDLVGQWVGLSLNPFPRSDAPLYKHVEADSKAPVNKPFEVLENLKGK